ncbi:helix-turn-helix domain-containing protein [Gluconacetobacter entanii]|uniref:Transcriptional regulator n=1 Tax=Gluconacetobacter entanii TaxID=108528 RepID=A0A318PXB1_9PROT|nr:transcriptional regulator [Gluconacetobacter entanii]
MNANISGAVEDIASAQVRAARGLLGWSRDRLVEASGVPKRTIVRFEDEVTAPRKSTISAIRAALEAAGVEFIAENGGGIGVRLRKSE